MAPILFRLNGEMRAEDNAPPTMTVLDYLRGVARLTGTKEGCAEGDCGACTIVVGEQQNDAIQYRAVNSCLMMLPQLNNCDVITVEGLTPPNGSLHPVQQTLVDVDATQCGFCTPGFVMAMVAFAQSGEAGTDENIHDALAGNLCRCTGYRPIVEACRKIAGQPGSAIAAKALPAMPADTEYKQGNQVCFLPRTLDALLTLRARHPDALIFGGGTDLGLQLSKERAQFPAVILTGGVRELKTVAAKDGAVVLGGAVTYSEALPALDRHFPAFAALVRRIGSRQIRNLGTFAGNLATASPIGDTLPCLIALGAEVTLHSKTAKRTLPVEDFITGYRKTALKADEVIASIRIPFIPAGERFAVYKLSKRFDQDISTVIAAFCIALDGKNVKDLRAAYGGMAAMPMRAFALETALAGKEWTAKTLDGADDLIAHDFKPMSDQRGGATYRLRAAANLVRRFQLETSEMPAPARLEAL
jgi:xanthine dehydrogenase small subunit